MLTMMAITLGQRLRELREQKDLSLRDLAKKVEGSSAAHLSDIEFGRRFPSPELLPNWRMRWTRLLKICASMTAGLRLRS